VTLPPLTTATPNRTLPPPPAYLTTIRHRPNHPPPQLTFRRLPVPLATDAP